MSDAITIRADDLQLLQAIAADWLTDQQHAYTPQQEAVLRVVARQHACTVADCMALVTLYRAVLGRQQPPAGHA